MTPTQDWEQESTHPQETEMEEWNEIEEDEEQVAIRLREERRKRLLKFQNVPSVTVTNMIPSSSSMIATTTTITTTITIPTTAHAMTDTIPISNSDQQQQQQQQQQEQDQQQEEDENRDWKKRKWSIQDQDHQNEIENNNHSNENAYENHHHPIMEQNGFDSVEDIFSFRPLKEMEMDESMNTVNTPTVKKEVTSASHKTIHSVPMQPQQGQPNQQDLDDAEGYYKASVGEILSFSFSHDTKEDTFQIHPQSQFVLLPTQTQTQTSILVKNISFRVLGIIGKGVFSTVVKCIRLDSTEEEHSNSMSLSKWKKKPPSSILAMKLIRNNETMAKAALKEIKILRLLHYSSLLQYAKREKKQPPKEKEQQQQQQQKEHESLDSERNTIKMEKEKDPSSNHNIVQFYEVSDFFPSHSSSTTQPPSHLIQDMFQSSYPIFEYRSHTAILFEYLPMNLREVLSKFGKHVGINLTAVRSYAKQLFIALQHLHKHHVVHADIKPDNILVSSNFQQIKLCDFGSAFFETDHHENDPTPYLVSRFYRAPEIILGLHYDHFIDEWSVGVTLVELFTGHVLFPGRTNNEMLQLFMESLGPFSNRMIRRHIQSYTGKLGLVPHFEEMSSGGTYHFRRKDTDPLTGQSMVRIVAIHRGHASANDTTAATTSTGNRNLAQILLRARSKNDQRGDCFVFADLLNKCIALDPAKRLRLDEILKHDFFTKKKEKSDPGIKPIQMGVTNNLFEGTR